jgi:lysylphosphatidylglycerol synthetase-like protein (DUF2156 family)
MENEQTTPPQATVKPLLNKEELAGFYKKGLPDMVKTIFLQPISGTLSLLSSPSEKTYFQSLVLMGSATLLYIIFPYLILPSQIRDVMGFSVAFKIGIAVLIFMLLVSATAFGIKSISGKADFKNELLTGGLCAIPLTVLLVMILIAKIFISESDMSELAFSPSAIAGKGAILGLVVFYVLLIFINILQQSLKAGGTKDALAWYLSPLGIMLSFYLTSKIGAAFF